MTNEVGVIWRIFVEYCLVKVVGTAVDRGSTVTSLMHAFKIPIGKGINRSKVNNYIRNRRRLAFKINIKKYDINIGKTLISRVGIDGACIMHAFIW